MFEYALVAGLTASGADVYLLHVTTTPSVSYAVRTEDFDCGTDKYCGIVICTLLFLPAFHLTKQVLSAQCQEDLFPPCLKNSAHASIR